MAGHVAHRAAFDAVSDGIVVHDPRSGVLLDVNTRMCEMHGYTREEFLTLSVEDFSAGTPPHTQENARRLIRQAASGEPQQFRWLNRRKGGERFWVEVRLRHAVLDGREQVVATVRDISELEQVEEGMRTYARLQEALEEMPVNVFAQDRELHYTWTSRTVGEAEVEYGHGANDQAQLDEEGTAAQLLEIKRRVLETGEPARAELRRIDSGEPRVEEVCVVPQHNAAGDITGLVGATVDVTERRSIEERYRRLFETAQEGIVIQGPDRTILDINPAGLEILGYGRHELRDTDPTELFANLEQRERLHEQVRAQEDIRQEKLNLRRKDGTEIICQVSTTVERGADGHPKGFYTVFRDITDRERREELFRHLVEEVEEYAIFMLDVEGYIITWNLGAQMIKGYTRGEILGQHVSVFYPSAKREDGFPDRGLEIAAREGQWIDEGWRLRKDSTRFWAHVTVTALHVDGRLRGFAKVVQDLTEERRMKEALRESEETFRALAEEAPMGITLIQDQQFKYVNDEYANIFGYDRDEMIGALPVEAVVYPDDRPKVLENLRRRIEGEVDAVQFRARGVTKQNEIIRLKIHGRRVSYQGQPAVIGSVLDVTEQRLLEEQFLSIQDAERRRIGRELHDGVASQLTGAAVMNSSLARQVEDGQPVDHEDFTRVITLINESIEEIRSLSHGLSPMGLDQGLVPALNELASRSQMHEELTCSINTSNPLPTLADDTAAHLYRIAQEAVTNAIKHADAQHIRISLVSKDSALVLTVQDDGCGIQEPVNEDGLGMRTMRFRANLTGSSLEIEEAPGGGTIVRCRLRERHKEAP